MGTTRGGGYLTMAPPDTGSNLINSAPCGGAGRSLLLGKKMMTSPILLNARIEAPYVLLLDGVMLVDLQRSVASVSTQDLWTYILPPARWLLQLSRPTCSESPPYRSKPQNGNVAQASNYKHGCAKSNHPRRMIFIIQAV